MEHSIGDGIIVSALSALFFGYLFLRYRTRIKRLELIHQERLVAMERDFPLPELPLDPPREKAPFNPLVPLILGIVLIMFGGGAMVAMRFSWDPEFQKPLDHAVAAHAGRSRLVTCLPPDKLRQGLKFWTKTLPMRNS